MPLGKKNAGRVQRSVSEGKPKKKEKKIENIRRCKTTPSQFQSSKNKQNNKKNHFRMGTDVEDLDTFPRGHREVALATTAGVHCEGCRARDKAQGAVRRKEPRVRGSAHLCFLSLGRPWHRV
jgi:hypothetical protein